MNEPIQSMQKIAGFLRNTLQVFFFESDFGKCLSQAMPQMHFKSAQIWTGFQCI